MADAEGVQQELQDYLHKKGINTLFINLVESLLLAKPENPILHIIQYLQSNYPDEATPRKKDGTPLKSDDNPASSHHSLNPRTSPIVCLYGVRSLASETALTELSLLYVCMGMATDHSDESDSEDDEEGDAVSEIQEKVVAPKPVVKGRRTSVSAETIDPSRCVLLSTSSVLRGLVTSP